GAGSGMFAVATRYHLRLYPLPKAIFGCSYWYPLSELGTVSTWLESIAPTLPSNIELSLFMLTAPPELADRCKQDGGKACMVVANVFADSEAEAKAALEPFDRSPAASSYLSRSVDIPLTFESMFDASGALWPEGQRAQVEAMYSNG